MKQKNNKSGLTLVELLFAASIGLILSAGVLHAYAYHLRGFSSATRHIQTAQTSSAGSFKLVYGTANQPSLREAHIDTVTVSTTGDDWMIEYGLRSKADSTNADGEAEVIDVLDGPHSYAYLHAQGIITDDEGFVVADNLVKSSVELDGQVLTLSMTSLMQDGGKTTTNTMSTTVVIRN